MKVIDTDKLTKEDIEKIGAYIVKQYSHWAKNNDVKKGQPDAVFIYRLSLCFICAALDIDIEPYLED